MPQNVPATGKERKETNGYESLITGKGRLQSPQPTLHKGLVTESYEEPKEMGETPLSLLVGSTQNTIRLSGEQKQDKMGNTSLVNPMFKQLYFRVMHNE